LQAKLGKRKKKKKKDEEDGEKSRWCRASQGRGNIKRTSSNKTNLGRHRWSYGGKRKRKRHTHLRGILQAEKGRKKTVRATVPITNKRIRRDGRHEGNIEELCRCQTTARKKGWVKRASKSSPPRNRGERGVIEKMPGREKLQIGEKKPEHRVQKKKSRGKHRVYRKRTNEKTDHCIGREKRK